MGATNLWHPPVPPVATIGAAAIVFAALAYGGVSAEEKKKAAEPKPAACKTLTADADCTARSDFAPAFPACVGKNKSYDPPPVTRACGPRGPAQASQGIAAARRHTSELPSAAGSGRARVPVITREMDAEGTL